MLELLIDISFSLLGQTKTKGPALKALRDESHGGNMGKLAWVKNPPV